MFFQNDSLNDWITTEYRLKNHSEYKRTGNYILHIYFAHARKTEGKRKTNGRNKPNERTFQVKRTHETIQTNARFSVLLHISFINSVPVHLMSALFPCKLKKFHPMYRTSIRLWNVLPPIYSQKNSQSECLPTASFWFQVTMSICYNSCYFIPLNKTHTRHTHRVGGKH